MVAIFGRSMRDQRSFDPYENPRLPAENAVSFASGNYPSAAAVVNVGQPEGLAEDLPPMSPVDMAPPGAPHVAGLVNPVPLDSVSLARGEVMYGRFCAVCHGDDGIGANAHIAGLHPTVSVYDVAGARVQAYPDGYVYAMIRIGRGLMPGYAHRVTHFDRWHIVNYVRDLQRRFNEANAGPPGGDR